MKAINSWKIHCLWLKKYHGGFLDFAELYSPEWPPLPQGTWLTKLPGTLTDYEKSLFAIYVATRSLPSGDDQAQEMALEKTITTLCTLPPVLNMEEKAFIQHYSSIAGREVAMCARKSKALGRKTHM